MDLSAEYNLARQHVAAIDFTYLGLRGKDTFSTELPPLEQLDLPTSDDEDQEKPEPTRNGYTFEYASKECVFPSC
jgi:hypothetical protein